MQSKLLPHQETEKLKGLSAEQLLQIIAQQQHQIEQSDAALIQQKNYIKVLEEYLQLAKAQKFGASSEKLPFQVDLFDEAELEEALSELEAQLPDEELVAPRRKQKRNRGFSEDLQRKRIELLLSDEERAKAERTFFSKVKEELEYIPAQLNVLEYWQEKAVFNIQDGKERKEQIIAAQRPVHPLGKCFASTTLLAYIIIAKYADGLPLYRLEGILKRYHGEISRTNMARWIVGLTTVLQPLINLLREHQNSGRHIHADETRIQVLKEDGKRAQSDKWMWVTCGGPPNQPSVLFEYDPTRSGAVAERLLDGFNGILQVDGYSGYAKVCR
ncbi:MAG: transposase, partial [Thiotrichales bacterium]|nr:transposase [Thiotrichales bacterium]